jgi:hypothetical protein
MTEPLREQRGRLVRETWVTWAKRSRHPLASWLTPFDDLDEDRRESCRLIGEAVAAAAVRADRARLFTAIRHKIPLTQPWRGEALDLICEVWRETDG